MKEQWKQDSMNEKFYPKREEHKVVPIKFELPVVAHAQSYEDYCKKIIATLKVLVLFVLLVLLSWTTIALYTNYRPKSALLVDDETTHEYSGRFDKAALKSNVHLDKSQNTASNITSSANLTVHPNHNFSNKNNSQINSGYSVKTRIARKADMIQLEDQNEEEFRKWLESFSAKNRYEDPQFKADLIRFLDDPNETSDDVRKLFTKVMIKYRDTVEELFMKNFMHSLSAVGESDEVSDADESLTSNKENDAAQFDSNNEKSGLFEFSDY